MIKARLRSKDPETPDMVLLGLTRENVERLVQGSHIEINLAELGLPPLYVAIVFGETGTDITQNLRKAGLPVNDMGEPGPGQRFMQAP